LPDPTLVTKNVIAEAPPLSAGCWARAAPLAATATSVVVAKRVAESVGVVIVSSHVFVEPPLYRRSRAPA
jgi:hypothetical protein